MRLLLLFAFACGSDPIVVPPLPECPPLSDYRDGLCQYIVPPLPCPPHSQPVLGEAGCAPVGPGPCTPPFESDGSEWGCRAIAAHDCPAGTAPILGAPECRPIGWSSCPAGFALEDAACTDVTTASACTGASRAALGELACVPIGDCSAPLPSGAIAVPGDHASIPAAIASAPDGATIAIDAGTYPEPILIDRPLALVGRCAELVVVTATAVRVAGEASISGMTIRGGEGVQAGADLILSAVVIEGATNGGVIAAGTASVRIERSAIRAVRSNAAGARGRGISAQQGASIEMDEVYIDDVRETGALATGRGSRASIDRSIITRVRPSAAGDGGQGVIAAFGASANVSRSLIADVVASGILAVSGTIEATDVVVRDIAPGPGNSGVRLEDASRFTASRLAIVRAAGTALLANNPGTVASLRDVVMADTVIDPDNGFSGGVFVAQSATVTLTRARIEGVASVGAVVALQGELALRESAIFAPEQGIGVLVQDSAAELSSSSVLGGPLAGVAVERSRAAFDLALIRGEGGRRLNTSGIDIHGAGEATIDRSAVAGYDGQGILMFEASSATVADSLIEEIRLGPMIAAGISALDRSRLLIQRTRVEDIEGSGVLSENGPLTIVDTAVLHTREVGPVTPAGVAAAGETTIRGSAFVGNTGVGAVFGRGTADLDRVLIASTRALSNGDFGHGLVAESATVSVERSALYDNASVAAFFDGSSALVDGTIVAKNGVGVHAQSGSFLIEAAARDPEGLQLIFTDSVLFLDNESRIGTGELPVPNPFEGLP